MHRVLIPLTLLSLATGCATRTASTPTNPTPSPNAWRVIPLASDTVPNDPNAHARAILLNNQTGETWMSADNGSPQWNKMSRN